MQAAWHLSDFSGSFDQTTLAILQCLFKRRQLAIQCFSCVKIEPDLFDAVYLFVDLVSVSSFENQVKS